MNYSELLPLIDFNYMNDSIIERNMFYGKNVAVELAGCQKCDVKLNTINSFAGIWVLFNGYSNVIADNFINSTEFGISYCGLNGRIENNTIRNGYFGIDIGFAIFTRVSRNVIKNCEIGIGDGFSLLSIISSNDFENNKINAVVIDSLLSVWRRNYWERPRILPVYIPTIFGLPGGFDYGSGFIIPWFKFDFRPALKPNHQ
jgi:hypothetical protein